MVDVRLLANIKRLCQQLDQTHLDGDIGIGTFLNRGGQPLLQATINWSTHFNGLGGISVDGNSQLLAGLGRVGGKRDRVYSDRIAGIPYAPPFSTAVACWGIGTHAPQIE